jgi:NADH-quinone oxidoreductase subunit C
MRAGNRQLSEALTFYIFYFLFLKNRMVFCFLNSAALSSVDSVYPNANWLEREFSEMFGVNLVNKVDARNLLLDYSLSENPLLRAFPSVGYREVHYSVLSESVVYSSGSAVEL